jgi:hypothetical protein
MLEGLKSLSTFPADVGSEAWCLHQVFRSYLNAA